MAKSKSLQIQEEEARNLLEQLEFSTAQTATVKKLNSILTGLPKRLEDEDEEPDVDKKGRKLLDKLADAIDKKIAIEVVAGEDEDDEDEEKTAKKGKSTKASKNGKSKGEKKTGKGEYSEAYARRKAQGEKIDKVLAKGEYSIEAIAEKTDLSPARVQNHVSWLEGKGKAKMKKNKVVLIESED